MAKNVAAQPGRVLSRADVERLDRLITDAELKAAFDRAAALPTPALKNGLDIPLRGKV